MESAITLFRMITTITDPVMLMFLAVLAVLGVAGLSVYAVIVALKHAGGRP